MLRKIGLKKAGKFHRAGIRGEMTKSRARIRHGWKSRKADVLALRYNV
ncbi:MAG TPA: hypothetical protein VKV95_05350 [Terriglobia bacterium]|nr:hypothetical protein [Terriglobia bacterium]